MNLDDYNRISSSDARSRLGLEVAAADANLAIKSAPGLDELRAYQRGVPDQLRARAFATMTVLALALEIALKGKLDAVVLVQLGLINRERDLRTHDLGKLFGLLPEVERNQMRACVKDIMLIDDDAFEALLDDCSDGFTTWRYFYESENEGKTYDYPRLVGFLYSAIYYLLMAEGMEGLLDDSRLRRLAATGDSGLLRQLKDGCDEFNEAVRVARSDDGTISDADAAWIAGIWDSLQSTLARARVLYSSSPAGV